MSLVLGEILVKTNNWSSRDRKLYSRFKKDKLYKVHNKGMAIWYQNLCLRELEFFREIGNNGRFDRKN